MIFVTIKTESQITYEEGYFIDNTGEKTECLIRNVDWMKNPDTFQYKLSENGEVRLNDISKVQEFGIKGISKYLRASVDIDRSSSDIDQLSLVREPSFSRETLFLLVLIEGKANLYKFEDKYGPNYFFKTGDREIEPLVYRKYITRDNKIGENVRYKQQLYNDLNHPEIKRTRFSNIPYKEKDLFRLFEDYNILYGASNPNNFVRKEKGDLFNFSIRPGLKRSSLLIQDYTGRNKTQYPGEFGFRIGAEVEGILPFNKNKWSLFVEPSYQTYKTKMLIREDTNTSAEVNYNTTEISFGGRHYMFFNKDSKLFLNMAYVMAWSNDSKINYNNGYYLELVDSSNFAFGLGYKYKSKYIFELNYNLDRGLLPQYVGYGREAVLSSYSVIFGYTLF